MAFNEAWSIENEDIEIVWSADRPLHWDDFRATPRGRALTGAVTHSTIKVTPKANQWTGRVAVSVQATFACNKSWVREKARSSEYLLNHEQRHFDIAELYARKLRKALQAERITAGNYKKIKKTIIEPLFQEYVEFDKEYDHTTVHGLNKDQQREWDQRIGAQLEDMGLYLEE